MQRFFRDISKFPPLADAVKILCGRGLTPTEAKEDLVLALRENEIQVQAEWSYRRGVDLTTKRKTNRDLHMESITTERISSSLHARLRPGCSG